MTFEEFVDQKDATINRDGGKWVLSYTKTVLGNPMVHEITALSLDELKSNTDVYIYDKLIDPFYLEISGRQTGKTTRMVEAMINHLYMGGSCILYCCKEKNFESICEMIDLKFGDTSNVYYYLNLKGRTIKRVRNYFDDFDFIESLNHLGAFDAKGYYCTTPSKIRNIENINKPNGDLLLELIKYSRFKCESRLNNKLLERHCMSDDINKLESGQIFK